MQQITDWLEKLGMSEYAERFAENDIDVAVLPDLTDQHLKDLGVSLGHRLRLDCSLDQARPRGTPIACAMAGCVSPLSRSSTIWMRWRCSGGIFHRSAVFSRRTSALLHLTILSPESNCQQRIILFGSKTGPAASTARRTDSSRHGDGIRPRFR
jgi:hypothetical protein